MARSKSKKKKKYGKRELPKQKNRARKVASKKVAVTAKKKKRAKREIGPTQAELTWDANYARACALHAEDPHTWWEGMADDDKSFGAWLKTQRYNRKIGRLRKDRERRLKKIKFPWDTIEATWELNLKALKKFINLKSSGTMWWLKLAKKNSRLELWCDAQRRALASDEISDERREKLDAIGFVWSPLDARWEVRFEELSAFLAEHPSGRVGKDNAPHGLLLWTMTQRRKYSAGEMDAERERRLEGIGFQWDGRKAKSDEMWLEHLEDLVAFHELTGDANPGPDDDEVTFRWLVAQRKIWDELPQERRAELEALGVSRETPPDQVVSRATPAREPDWAKFFKQSTAFKKKYGHLRITRDRASQKFPGLANFAGRLRSGTVEPDEGQQAKLEELEFVWDLRAARTEEFFDGRLRQLEAFKAEHGHTNVSQLDEKNKALGQWVTRARQTRAELSAGQRVRLEALGIVWELKKEWMEGQWDLRFSELLEYKRQYGDTLVPQDCPEWYTLSRWVSRMRQTKSKLEKGRVQRLEEVGFVWDAKAAERAATEAARYAELAAFVDEHGHARVTRGSDPTGGKLNAWIVRQREKRKKGKMNPAFEARLDALGFVWKTR